MHACVCACVSCTYSDAMRLCTGGDRTDRAHHKQRCAAGFVVTGVASVSGDWLDSVSLLPWLRSWGSVLCRAVQLSPRVYLRVQIQYVCSPLWLVKAMDAETRRQDALNGGRVLCLFWSSFGPLPPVILIAVTNVVTTTFSVAQSTCAAGRTLKLRERHSNSRSTMRS